MLDLLTNLTKAAVATALTPVAAVVDVLTLPASSMDPHRSPFGRTAKLAEAAGKCVSAALRPGRLE